MSLLYWYIFESLFGLLQKTRGIYLAGEHWHWNSAEDNVVLYWRSATTAIQKNDLVEIAHVCSFHYVHFLFEWQQIHELRMLAVQCSKNGYWQSLSLLCSNASLSCPCPGNSYSEALFSASEGVFLSVSMHESHCFNYIHVITSINYNACVCWVEACVLKFLIMWVENY